MTTYQLFDALPSHIEDALRASIERFGVLVPITVDQHGNLLDGHHRKRIAEELKVPFDRLKRWCEDDDERREIARTLNADRRQLSEEQRREVAADLRQQGHSYRAIGGALGVDERTVRRDMERSTAAGAAVDEPDRITGLDGKSRPSRRPQVLTRNDREQEQAPVLPDMSSRGASIDAKRAERIAREQEADRRRAEPIEPVTITADVDIRHGDFRETLADLSDVDAIITDPPYPNEFIPLFGDLSEVASRILKPDGVLVVMTGQSWMREYLAELDKHMVYRWTAAYIAQGARTRVHVAKVGTGWKPLFIYQRKEASEYPFLVDDLFDAACGTRDGTDKQFHHWGQSEAGIAEQVERFTEPGDLVVDPFLGGGTTAVVSRDLGRRFVGCDIDAAAITTSRERCA